MDGDCYLPVSDSTVHSALFPHGKWGASQLSDVINNDDSPAYQVSDNAVTVVDRNSSTSVCLALPTSATRLTNIHEANSQLQTTFADLTPECRGVDLRMQPKYPSSNASKAIYSPHRFLSARRLADQDDADDRGYVSLERSTYVSETPLPSVEERDPFITGRPDAKSIILKPMPSSGSRTIWYVPSPAAAPAAISTTTDNAKLVSEADAFAGGLSYCRLTDNGGKGNDVIIHCNGNPLAVSEAEHLANHVQRPSYKTPGERPRHDDVIEARYPETGELDRLYQAAMIAAPRNTVLPGRPAFNSHRKDFSSTGSASASCQTPATSYGCDMTASPKRVAFDSADSCWAPNDIKQFDVSEQIPSKGYYSNRSPHDASPTGPTARKTVTRWPPTQRMVTRASSEPEIVNVVRSSTSLTGPIASTSALVSVCSCCNNCKFSGNVQQHQLRFRPQTQVVPSLNYTSDVSDDVRRLERLLYDRDDEIRTLRVTMERNERAMLQVIEDTRSSWAHEFERRFAEFDNRSRTDSDHALRKERKLREEISRLETTNAVLRSAISDIRPNPDTVVKTANAAPNSDQSKNQLRNVFGSSAVAQTGETDCKIPDDGLNAKKLESGLKPFDDAAEPVKSDRLAASPSKFVHLQSGSHNGGDCGDDVSIVTGRLQGQLEQVTEELESVRRQFDESRKQWLLEKEKVIAYQQQLQQNYVQAVTRCSALENELCQLTSELTSLRSRAADGRARGQPFARRDDTRVDESNC